MSEGRLPTNVPLFPLNIVALPGEIIPLHIFEDRYRDLVTFCLAGEEPPAKQLFGILHQENQKRSRIGCLVRITEIFHRYLDGRLDLLCVGEDRFELVEEFEQESFSRARIMPFNDFDEVVPAELVQAATELFEKVISTFKLDPKPEPECPLTPLSFRLAKQTVTRIECRQKLLVMQSEIKRLQYLCEIYTELVHTVAARDEMKRIIQLNGHFGIPS
jgi:Lon protease-like protein